MLPHGDRHLPCVQRPHTHGHSRTRSLTHSCLTHTHHTRGGTHPRSFTHTWGFTHPCRFSCARGYFPLRCPFYTRRAGKHALRHARNHTTRTRGLFRTRGLTWGYTRGHSRTRGFTHTWGLYHTRGLFHTREFFHTRGRSLTRGLIHTRGFTRTRGRFHTRPFTPGMRAATHAQYACVMTFNQFTVLGLVLA